MPQTSTATPIHRHGSRSMILQPEDVVALTAEEAAADIDDAMRAFARENHNEEGPGRHPPRTRG